MDGPAYELWVAGYDVETGAPKGRLRHDEQGLRFVEVVVNGPKTWSLAAALHPEIAAAYDAVQDKAATEIIGWLADHATTRVGPRGRQVQVPVEQLEAAVVRHYTSRAAISTCRSTRASTPPARGEGCTRSAWWTASRQSTGSGTPAVACDPEFRGVLAAHGYTLDPAALEVTQLTPYVGPFSARAAQITATSTATKPSGAASILTSSPARHCGGPGIVEHGLRPDPTKSCLRSEPSSGSGGSTSCTSSVALPRLSEWSTVPSRSDGSTGMRWSTWCCRAWGRVARAGIPPTFAARSSGSLRPPTSWHRRRYATSWSRT